MSFLGQTFGKGQTAFSSSCEWHWWRKNIINCTKWVESWMRQQKVQRTFPFFLTFSSCALICILERPIRGISFTNGLHCRSRTLNWHTKLTVFHCPMSGPLDSWPATPVFNSVWVLMMNWRVLQPGDWSSVLPVLHNKVLLMSGSAVLGVQCEQKGSEHAALGVLWWKTKQHPDSAEAGRDTAVGSNHTVALTRYFCVS